jgi:Domain of unknown function (DUF4167)
MRQQPSGRRPRGRSNRKHFVPHRSQTYDSHGPEVRVRGNALQVYEKYVNLARDASSAGDRIAAESYQQYAEHYYRIINDTTDPQRPSTERPDADFAAPERAGADRQTGGHQPYPMDAEQPFLGGGEKKSTPDGNGQAPEVEAKPAASGEPAAGDGAAGAAPAEAPPVVEKKDKPRGRGRPRTRAKTGNGAADEDDIEDASTAASAGPDEAGEPTT